MTAYLIAQQALVSAPRTWLVTGAAGFIGSHLVERLLKLRQNVVGLDSFVTGKRTNLELVKQSVGDDAWELFRFIEGDIRDLRTCHLAAAGVDYILHQAGLGSVPRSFEQPLAAHQTNVNGFFNMLLAAREAGVIKLVYASSSSVYGDQEDLPKRELDIGAPLSPYAATKKINEIYAQVFQRCFDLRAVGLRYFNVFGARQDPDGPYAAVIPKWVASILQGETFYINGTGETSRDFTYVADVVQMNLLAALSSDPRVYGQVFNCAASCPHSLNELAGILRRLLTPACGRIPEKPSHRPFRKGDIKHSFADISKARELLGYSPTYSLEQGLGEALPSFIPSEPELGFLPRRDAKAVHHPRPSTAELD